MLTDSTDDRIAYIYIYLVSPVGLVGAVLPKDRRQEVCRTHGMRIGSRNAATRIP